MTTNSPEIPVGVADALPLFDCPNWLSIRLDSTLTPSGRALGETFLRAVVFILKHKPPERAIISCEGRGGAFDILFDCVPRCRDAEHVLVESLADALQELHKRRFSALRREEKQLPVNEEPTFLDDDFDIDQMGIVTQPQQSTSVPIFRFAENAGQLEQRIKGRDSDASRRIAQTLERLARSGMQRPLVSPADDWPQRMAAFAESFPNFQEVIETAIRPHIALCAAGLSHRLAPILLVGTPGIGKTRFANALSDLLGVPPPLFVSMAAETNASTLAGSSTFWSNSSPGQLFESLAWGRGGHSPVANGLIILDEIDKAKTSGYSVLGPLYALLEEHTARNFEDQSLPDLVFDASHVRLIATCNDLDQVPAPLQSRMLVFHISQPSPGQLFTIAQQILAEMVRRMAVQFCTELPQELMPQIEGMSPRSIKLAAEIAFARAVVAQRSQLLVQDWPALNLEPAARGRRHPVGFLSGV